MDSSFDASDKVTSLFLFSFISVLKDDDPLLPRNPTQVTVDTWPVASTPVEILGSHTVPRNSGLTSVYGVKKPRSLDGLASYKVSPCPLIFVACVPAMEKVIADTFVA